MITFLVIFFIACCIAGIVVGNHYSDKRKWERIETLNVRTGITKQNAYIDPHGYLRWRDTNRLCHRDIAWKNGLRGNDKFGNCDIHHVDGNKWNNDPLNLEVLVRAEHEIKHGNVIFENGRKYIKLARTRKIYKETRKAIMVARKWIPKSQVIYRNGYVYITEWIWKQKGF